MYKVPGTGVGVTTGGVGTLAATGANVGWWIAIGVVLILLGTVAVIAAYRRSRRLTRTKR